MHYTIFICLLDKNLLYYLADTISYRRRGRVSESKHILTADDKRRHRNRNHEE